LRLLVEPLGVIAHDPRVHVRRRQAGVEQVKQQRSFVPAGRLDRDPAQRRGQRGGEPPRSTG
jgi:hypothetical protein